MANRMLTPDEPANASVFLAQIDKRLKELDSVSPCEFYGDASAAVADASSNADDTSHASMS